MKTYINKKESKNFQSAANSIVQRKNNNTTNLSLEDNRQKKVLQQKNLDNTNSSLVQRFPFDKDGNDLGAIKPPQVRDIYSLARSVFGNLGSPQIKGIHEQMESTKHPLLDETAGFVSGWKAGKHENNELSKLKASDDWRDEQFAKNPIAMTLRPFSAAFAGAGLKSMYYMNEGMRQHRLMKTGQDL